MEGLAPTYNVSGVLVLGQGFEVDVPGSEGAGDGEEDDLLVRPLFTGVVFLGTAAGGWVGIGDGSISGSPMLAMIFCFSRLQCVVLYVVELDALRQRVTDFERSHDDQLVFLLVD